MSEKERPYTPEIPTKWGSCTIKIISAINEVVAVKRGMEIADFFSDNFGVIARGNDKVVVLEPRSNKDGKAITDLSEINQALRRMIDEGTKVTFS